MSQTTNLSRYRPAIFAITGAAAAYGIYILYSTFPDSHPAKGGLRRSNAVHRPRPRHFRIKYLPPGPDWPLGVVFISKGDVTQITNVRDSGAPTVAAVRDQFPDVPESEYPQQLLDCKAVQSVMNACFQAIGDDERQARLRQCGVAGISEALQAGDWDRILALATPLLHQIVDTDHETIQSATVSFLTDVESGIVRPTFELAGANPEDQTVPSEFAETEDLSVADSGEREPEQGLRALLYHIAETEARRRAYEHRGIVCEECGNKPIRGVRWHCLNCPDYDLCDTCETGTTHPKTHVFAKIKIPLPILSQPTRTRPVWYPGEPRYSSSEVPRRIRESITHTLDGAKLDAYFDQFTSIANARWEGDPWEIQAVITRHAFDRALTSERWPRRFQPNAMYDRIFAFYDRDGNGVINFEEFLNGMQYLRGPDRFKPLTPAIQGFDMDSDGYVDRNDFLRLLRAKFDIHRRLINDHVESREAKQTQAAMGTLRSSQPISSVFQQEEIPQGENRAPTGKIKDVNGDMQPLDSTKTILGDDEGWPKERAQRQRLLRLQPEDQLRHHISRFEEMLQSPTSTANVRQLDGAEGSGESEPTLRSSEEAFHGSDHDSPINEDVIWQVTEDGFNEILDPLFNAREQKDHEVIEARPEIQRWLKEIEQALQQQYEAKVALAKELQDAEAVDPLMATAMSSLNGSVQVESKDPAETAAQPAFSGDIMPTDHESLTRREEEIKQKELDELLNEAGYSVVDAHSTDEPTAGPSGHQTDNSWEGTESSVRSEDTSPSRKGNVYERQFSDSDGSADPTMPQNRADPSTPQQTRSPPSTPPHSPSPPPSKQEDNTPTAKQSRLASRGHQRMRSRQEAAETPPSKTRLEYLGSLIEIDEEIGKRGGPGRLSYAEVEAAVEGEGGKELRGLVVGWLEWGSF